MGHVVLAPVVFPPVFAWADAMGSLEHAGEGRLGPIADVPRDLGTAPTLAQKPPGETHPLALEVSHGCASDQLGESLRKGRA